jgi:hypothetical protein
VGKPKTINGVSLSFVSKWAATSTSKKHHCLNRSMDALAVFGAWL